MRKEFILGKRYKCILGGVSFIRGEVYDTEQRKSQSFVNLVQLGTPSYDFSGYSRGCFNSYTFEEVKDDEETINVEVGDSVSHPRSPSDKHTVVVVIGNKAWVRNCNDYDHIVRLTGDNCYHKVKDIRTIECAGGAVRITGEYVPKDTLSNQIAVRTAETYMGMRKHYGIEVPQTPSQPH